MLVAVVFRTFAMCQVTAVRNNPGVRLVQIEIVLAKFCRGQDHARARTSGVWYLVIISTASGCSDRTMQLNIQLGLNCY